MEFDQLSPGIRIRLLSNGPSSPEHEGLVVYLSEGSVEIKWRPVIPGSTWFGAVKYSKESFNTFKNKVVGPKITKTFKDLL